MTSGYLDNLTASTTLLVWKLPVSRCMTVLWHMFHRNTAGVTVWCVVKAGEREFRHSPVVWHSRGYDLNECPEPSTLAFIACGHLRDVKWNESANSPIWCRGRKAAVPGIIYSTIIIKPLCKTEKGSGSFPNVLFYWCYSCCCVTADNITGLHNLVSIRYLDWDNSKQVTVLFDVQYVMYQL